MRTLVNNDTVTIKCTRCESVLAVECDDVETDDICHGRPAEFWVHCPECGTCLGLGRKDLPNHWLSLIMFNNNIED